jgi:hypothetical protein
MSMCKPCDMNMTKHRKGFKIFLLIIFLLAMGNMVEGFFDGEKNCKLNVEPSTPLPFYGMGCEIRRSLKLASVILYKGSQIGADSDLIE